MCRECALVRAALDGALPKESIHQTYGYYVIIDNPESKTSPPEKLCIYKHHQRLPLLTFRTTMYEAADSMFPNHNIHYDEKVIPDHFFFHIRPKRKKSEATE